VTPSEAYNLFCEGEITLCAALKAIEEFKQQKESTEEQKLNANQSNQET
jgi:hypothetical protein